MSKALITLVLRLRALNGRWSAREDRICRLHGFSTKRQFTFQTVSFIKGGNQSAVNPNEHIKVDFLNSLMNWLTLTLAQCHSLHLHICVMIVMEFYIVTDEITCSWSDLSTLTKVTGHEIGIF